VCERERERVGGKISLFLSLSLRVNWSEEIFKKTVVVVVV